MVQEENFFFPEHIYNEHLTVINDIIFTRREIDVISCLLSMRGTSRIAKLLSIAPRTIVTHIRNIMLKLGCNSRESIIDFIENSQKLFLLRKHYSSLLAQEEFEKVLKEIGRLKSKEKPLPLIIYYQNDSQKNILIDHLESHLKYVGLHTEIKDYDCNFEILEKSNNIMIFLLEKKDSQIILQNLDNFNLIDFTNIEHYYLLVLSVLGNFFPDNNLQDITRCFKEKYEQLYNYSYEKQNLKLASFANIKILKKMAIKFKELLFNYSTKIKKRGLILALGLFCLSIGYIWNLYVTSSINFGLTKLQWVYNRNEIEQAETYQRAKREIVLLIGKGGQRIHDTEVIWNALTKKANQGIKVCLLIVSPQTKQLDDYPDIRKDVERGIRKIQEWNKTKRENKGNKIEIKLLSELPTVTIEMIDGDLNSVYTQDNKRKLLLIPKISSVGRENNEESLILTFKDTGNDSPYFNFRKILVNIWKNASSF